MSRGSQLVRQWRLLQFVRRPEGLAVDDAARRLECTVRTVWRDLRVVQDAGFPIRDEREGWRGLWKLEEGFRATPNGPRRVPARGTLGRAR